MTKKDTTMDKKKKVSAKQPSGLASMSNDELMTAARELHDSIYVVDCFGSRDLLNYELTIRELGRRGIYVQESTIPTIAFRSRSNKVIVCGTE
jgi:hypothetical protein